ncbi:hypothetical protein SAMN04489761_3777 [Tenacibaculum sp. MAR_2009_124]|uniref:hypothetical protein n=1 Tax=Tenacibaculum sp. MAR_2009_124 TaxID=1250059 RepID=UPI00089B3107|nr:hypothetical protein [Tenacibaculum sp. MAR_2009_124]SEC85391.1 hypothetical protein SAMN04489761_3777 [Tenacibaculum sp. MAR_2009_124]
MISYLERGDLNLEKYDDCIENAIQYNVFGYSWYLDVICEQWGAYVLNDYEAVMPIPWRRKMFVKYVHPPLWLIHLGIYSKQIEDENEFLIEVFDDFRFVELRMNSKNSFNMFEKFQKEKQVQILSLKDDYEIIRSRYNRNRKRELQKSIDFDLTENWGGNTSKFIELFRNNVGKRVYKIKESDYQNLDILMQICIQKKVGELLLIYDKSNNLVSGAFFLKQKNRVTELVCSSDFKNRKNGANTFMNDRAIYKYQKNFDVFDFGGSSMKNIATYYKSFGAKDENYIQLVYNNLPKLLKLFKG